jgi:hypothetical protein
MNPSSRSFTARRAWTSCGRTRTGGAWSRCSRRRASPSSCLGEATPNTRGASASPRACPMRAFRHPRGNRCPRSRPFSRARNSSSASTRTRASAAALGTPTVSLFVATDPRSCGVGLAGPWARDLGGIGAAPTPEMVERTRRN